MKVKELIEELQALEKPEAKVIFYGYDFQYAIDYVAYDPKENTVDLQ